MKERMLEQWKKGRIFWIILVCMMVVSSSAAVQAADMGRVEVTGTVCYSEGKQIVEKMNMVRTAYGLSPLTVDSRATDAAVRLSEEQSVFLGNTRPSGYPMSGILADAGVAGPGVSSMDAELSVGYGDFPEDLSCLKGKIRTYNSVGVGVFRNSSGHKFWAVVFLKSNRLEGGTVKTVDVRETIGMEAHRNVTKLQIMIGEERKLLVGDTTKLQIESCSSNHTILEPSSWKWTSSDPNVATIGQDGTMKATGEGMVTITASNLADPNFIVTAEYFLSGMVIEALPEYHTASGTFSGGLKWSLAKGVLTISGNGEMRDFMTGIDQPWYPYLYEIQQVVIQDGVKSIGQAAFMDFVALQKLTVAGSVEYIWTRAFDQCTELKMIRFEGALPTISYSFGGVAATVYYPSAWERVPDPDDYGGSPFVWVPYASSYRPAQKPNGETGSGQNPNPAPSQTPGSTPGTAPSPKPATVAAKSVKLNRTAYTLAPGKTITLKATVSPSNTSNKKVTWSSSNRKVATVTNGKVKAVSPGTATIKVKTANGKTAKCIITVKPAQVTGIQVKALTGKRIKISWKKVTGASGYIVYRKTAGTSWKKVATTTKTSFMNGKLKAGTRYTYTVRAYKIINKKRVLADYNKKGVSARAKK